NVHVAEPACRVYPHQWSAPATWHFREPTGVCVRQGGIRFEHHLDPFGNGDADVAEDRGGGDVDLRVGGGHLTQIQFDVAEHGDCARRGRQSPPPGPDDVLEHGDAGGDTGGCGPDEGACQVGGQLRQCGMVVHPEHAVDPVDVLVQAELPVPDRMFQVAGHLGTLVVGGSGTFPSCRIPAFDVHALAASSW